MKRLRCVCSLIILSILFLTCSCTQNKKSYFVDFEMDKDSFYVDGKNLSVYQFDELVVELQNIVQDIENSVSVEYEESSVFKLNGATANQHITVDEHTYQLLILSKQLYSTTKAFTPSLYNLTTLWGFSPANEGNYTQSRPEPSVDEIASVKQTCNFDDIILDENSTVYKLNSATKIDFGGIAKGYICDKLKEYVFQKYQGKIVAGSIEVMSNLVVFGHFNDNGVNRGWNILVSNPRTSVVKNDSCFRLDGVYNSSVTTSSDCYRFYINNSKIYSHIIDYSTGKPADNKIISVTTVVPESVKNSGAIADAYSTASFCKPLTQSLEMLHQANNEFGLNALVICADYSYYVVGDINVQGLEKFGFSTPFVYKPTAQACDTIINSAKEEEYISLMYELYL